MLYTENECMLCNVEQHNVEVGESDFDQLSLNLAHCTVLQTDIEPRYPWTRFDTQ